MNQLWFRRAVFAGRGVVDAIFNYRKTIEPYTDIFQ